MRATIAASAAYKTLLKNGILETVSYVAGCSGSSWYLTTLHSHPAYGSYNGVVDQVHKDLKEAVSKPIVSLESSEMVKSVLDKHSQGQKVSLVDFLGCLVGQRLIKDRDMAKLSDQGGKNGPLPIHCCIQLKPGTKADEFQDWIELNPFEASFHKYGVSLPIQDFGSKFYGGSVVKREPERPLAFYQGLLGSVFSMMTQHWINNQDLEQESAFLKKIHGSSNSPTSSSQPKHPNITDSNIKKKIRKVKVLKKSQSLSILNVPLEALDEVEAWTGQDKSDAFKRLLSETLASNAKKHSNKEEQSFPNPLCGLEMTKTLAHSERPVLIIGKCLLGAVVVK